MKSWRGFYRLLGAAWVLLAAAILLVSVVYLVVFNIAKNPLNNLFLDMPVFSQIALGILRDASPRLMEFLGIIFAAFVIYLGIAIFGLKGWARTTGIVFHIAMGASFMALAVAVFNRTKTSLVLQQLGVVETVPMAVLIMGLLIGAVLLLIGFQMGSRSALEAFAGVVPPPAAYPVVLCPTCNQPMDVQNASCPRCDLPEGTVQPSGARLVDLENNTEYRVSIRKPTRIGREGGEENESFEVLLPYPIVSSDHAMIEYNNGAFYIHAHKDLNFTYVNDVLMRDAPIQNGDTITFGNAKFRFEVIQ